MAIRLNYSTGQVATITGLSMHTVIRCTDSGDLPSFLVPNSRHRRIPAAALRAWMTRHGMPLDRIDADQDPGESSHSAAVLQLADATPSVGCPGNRD